MYVCGRIGLGSLQLNVLCTCARVDTAEDTHGLWHWWLRPDSSFTSVHDVRHCQV